MIYVRPPILTEEEWAMGESVTDAEFWNRYGTVQGRGRGQILEQRHEGQPYGSGRPNGADSQKARPPGCGQAAGADAVGMAQGAIG
jgi:hypothetical protein